MTLHKPRWRPFLCRLGAHRWRVKEFALKGTYYCERCFVERSGRVMNP